jgi:hypothetical protein
VDRHETSYLFNGAFVLFHADCKKVRRHEGANLIGREVNPVLSQRRTFSDLFPCSRFTTPGLISLGDAVCPTSKEKHLAEKSAGQVHFGPPERAETHRTTNGRIRLKFRLHEDP